MRLPPPMEDNIQGKLELWAELIPKKDISSRPMEKISPEPNYDMELRVIVLSTNDCVFKDEIEKCNDLYVKGGPSNLSVKKLLFYYF